jgi:hypothetical protein
LKRRLSARRATVAPGPAGFAPRSGRPQGGATRGKTAAGRLRHVDSFCALYAAELLRAPAASGSRACFVDLGFGAAPWTTLESGALLRRLAPGLRIVGLEIDRERVRAAEPYGDPDTVFRLGGFELPMGTDEAGLRESPRLVRAFNVLRQYEEAAVPAALGLMGRALEPGGLLVEGSSDPAGRLWCAHVWRRAPEALRHEALVFGLRPGCAAEPGQLPAVLPKDLVHAMGDDGAIAAFFADWRAAWEEAAALSVWGPRQRLTASALGLRRRGHAVDPRRRWLGRGLLLWRGPNPADAAASRT